MNRRIKGVALNEEGLGEQGRGWFENYEKQTEKILDLYH